LLSQKSTAWLETPHSFEVRNRDAENPTRLGAITAWRDNAPASHVITRSVSRIYTASINDHVRGTARSALNVARSVAAHEVGHILGLGDNPPGIAANSTLMSHSRQRNTVTRHTVFDTRNVRLIYGVA